MKTKFLMLFSIAFVLAFAAAVYAFSQSTVSGETTASSGAKTDACPLKNKNVQMAAAENHLTESCCDSADCCCKSGACPMKSSGEKGSADCCGNCCDGSCPMKNKSDAETSVAQTKEASCHHNRTTEN